MSAIDKVTAHWASVSALRQIEVPEWELTVWYRPPNVAERMRLERALKEDGDHAAAVEAVVLLARDDAGQRIFRDADKPELMRKADPAVITRLATAMMSGPDPEEVGNA